MPTISKAGGSFEGAQFDFDALVLERLQAAIHLYACMLIFLVD